MAITLEELENRLAALEAEVASLKQRMNEGPKSEDAADRGARLLAEAKRDQRQIQDALARVFDQMGIRGAPVSPEELRAMMAADGIKAEDNLFSRGITEMRDE
jgi:hypothetical protein